MKKKSSISLGPGASSLILIFVVLSLSVLGMLSLMTSRNDQRLSQRSAEVIEAVYALNAAAEERRAQIDETLAASAAEAADAQAYEALVSAALPAGVTLEEHVLRWEETDGTRTLTCALSLEPLGGKARTQWLQHDLASQIADDTEDLWN